jgi:two-component system cell cycle sensor histidine kinase/response regulator CckA
MAMQNVSEEFQPKSGEGLSRGGSIGMVLLVALVLVGAAIGLLFVGRGRAEGYILTMLAGLAMIGVFALFAGAAGILRVATGETRPISRGSTPATSRRPARSSGCSWAIPTCPRRSIA